MNIVTFLQLRPAETVNEVWASTRRREGTLAVEVSSPTLQDVVEAQKSGLLLVSGDGGVAAPAYALAPRHIKVLGSGEVAGWRITIVNEGSTMHVVDALALTRASFLQIGRASCRERV